MAPEISVTGNGVDVPFRNGNGSESVANGTDFGTVANNGTIVDRTFVITNTGTAPLNLGANAVSIGLAQVYSVLVQPASVVAPGQTTSFTLRFTAQQGSYGSDVTIVNDDGDEGPYSFPVFAIGNASLPEINVTGNSQSIVDGDTSPDAADHTDFGSTEVTVGTVSRTFTIENTGTANLTLGANAATLSGTNAGDYSISAQPATTVSAAGSTSVTVQFDPGVFGARVATLSIANDDGDEAPYNFALAGAGTGAPEINVVQNVTNIPDNPTNDPAASSATSFGTGVGGSNGKTYTISNTGTGPLTIGANAVSLTGTDVARFSVAQPPAATLAPGGSTTFQINFSPDAPRAFGPVDVAIANDDGDENPYNFRIQGAGQGVEVNVTGNGQTITDNAAHAPGAGDHTDFGSIDIASGTVVRTFAIENNGFGFALDLQSASAVSISGAHASDFVVTQQPAQIVHVGAPETFEVTFNPSAAGLRGPVDVTITNDDTDESPYNFRLHGTGSVAPEINVTGNGQNIADGDTVPSTADHTDFGSADTTSGMVSRTFTIQNTGTNILTLGVNAASLSGTNAADFAIMFQPAVTVAAASSTTVVVQFDPLTLGAKAATLTINSDDGDEAVYDFTIAGTGTGAAEIEISSSEGGPLADGDIDAHGSEPSGIVKTVTYTITNSGLDTLNLINTAPTVSGGVNVGMPTIGNYSSTALAASGGTATFTVTYTPSIAGAFSFDLDILSDDADEATYDISVSGSATDITAPRIASIERNTPTTAKTDADALIWRVTFDEPVTGVDTSDFSVAGTTAIVTGVTVVSTSIYNITVSGGDLVTLEATVTLTLLVVGADKIEDTAGNDFANATPIGTNDNTFIISNDIIAPSVSIDNAPSTHDRSTVFNVSFQFSEDVTGFVVGDITVVDGTVSNFVIVDSNTYTADITPSGAYDVTIDVAASVADDLAGNDNLAATQVLVKSSIAEETQIIIADFMINRANHILNNQPDMIGFLTGSNNGGGGPLGNLQYESDFSTKTIFSFSTSRSKILAAGKGDRVTLQVGSESQTHAQTDLNGLGSFGLLTEQSAVELDPLRVKESDNNALSDEAAADKNRTGSWDVWAEIHGAQSTQTDVVSKFWNASVGSHFFVNNETLLGLVAQFDWADEINNTAGSNVSGTGYMVGPYVAGKIKDQNFYYEARALWGQSTNQITPIGTYTDTFKTERWLASAKLQGVFKLNDLVINPTLSLSYFEEMQKSYTDTNAYVIPEQTISLGEFKFGPEITRSFDIGGGYRLGTNVGISGIINFGVRNGASSTSNAFGNNQVRARVDAGLDLVNTYGTKFSIAGYYDGLGASGFHSYGGKFGLIVPIQ